MRVTLPDTDTGTRALFAKRQENHLRRTLRHPIAGEPTLAVKMRNILALGRANLPTLRPVYCAQRHVGGCTVTAWYTTPSIGSPCSYGSSRTNRRRCAPYHWCREPEGALGDGRPRTARVAAAPDCRRKLEALAPLPRQAVP